MDTPLQDLHRSSLLRPIKSNTIWSHQQQSWSAWVLRCIEESSADATRVGPLPICTDHPQKYNPLFFVQHILTTQIRQLHHPAPTHALSRNLRRRGYPIHMRKPHVPIAGEWYWARNFPHERWDTWYQRDSGNAGGGLGEYSEESVGRGESERQGCGRGVVAAFDVFGGVGGVGEMREMKRLSGESLSL